MMGDKIASVVTTYNRPEQLAKTLPQVVKATGKEDRVLIVDDGTPYRTVLPPGLYNLIDLSENRGLACALNIGLSYWLADPGIEFISVFQDDCDVDPDLHRVMLDVWRGTWGVGRRLLTGFDAVEHKKGQHQVCGGVDVYTKTTGGGVHLFGNRSVWESLMPIPSMGVGLPKNGRGSRVDFNLTSHARGGAVPLLCVPGLVSHRAWKGEDSTWGSTRVCGQDGPLSREAIKGWTPC